MKDHAESFLSRWSRRKLASAREPHVDTGNGKEAAAPCDAGHDAGPARLATGQAAALAAPAQGLNLDADAVMPPGHGLAGGPGAPPAGGHGALAGGDGTTVGGQTTTTAAAPGASPALASNGEPARLPPVESLTFDSDFTRFMAPSVDPAVRRAALRKLLHDPRFNVMDGLDVYIDDYSQPSPIAPEVVRELAHARYLFAPPRTRINAQGQVEDVADDVPAAAGAAIEGEIHEAAPREGSVDATASAAKPRDTVESREGDAANAVAVDASPTGAVAGDDPRASDMTCPQADATPARLPITGEPA